MKLPDFEAWAVFATVAAERSFTRAGAALGISKATVSKSIARLETRLGAVLLHRTSRTLTLTEAGRRLLPHAERILAEATGAEEAAADEATAPAGLVRLAAPMSFGMERVAPAIADFLALYPRIAVDLALSDALIDLVAEGVDMALRIGALPDSSLRARTLCPIPVRIVAAPAWIAAHGAPAHPRDLADSGAMLYANMRVPELWRLIGPGGEEAAVRPRPRLIVNSGDAMRPALRAGLGVAVLPEFIVAADLASGDLVTILDGWGLPGLALHLVTPPGRLRPARVEALIGFLAERFGGHGGNLS